MKPDYYTFLFMSIFFYHESFTNPLEIHFINMVKYRKQGKGKLDNPLCRWLAWFDKGSPPKLLEEVVKMDAAIQTAEERFAHIIRDKDELLAYDRYVLAQCDRTAELNFALDKGYKKGFKKYAY